MCDFIVQGDFVSLGLAGSRSYRGAGRHGVMLFGTFVVMRFKMRESKMHAFSLIGWRTRACHAPCDGGVLMKRNGSLSITLYLDGQHCQAPAFICRPSMD